MDDAAAAGLRRGLGRGCYQTCGTGPDLMENAKNAIRDLIGWLVTGQQLSSHEAYTLCCVAGDLKINGTVDLPNCSYR